MLDFALLPKISDPYFQADFTIGGDDYRLLQEYHPQFISLLSAVHWVENVQLYFSRVHCSIEIRIILTADFHSVQYLLQEQLNQ